MCFQKYFFYITKSQRLGLFTTVVLILFFEIAQSISFKKDDFNLTEADKILLKDYAQKYQDRKNLFSYNGDNILDSKVKPFNPNIFNKDNWVEIGFSEKQADAIIKYKQTLGGKFTSKNQLKKCFVISNNMYLALHQYILLPEELDQENKLSTKHTSNIIKYSPFDPNSYLENDWQKIGFTNKQAQSIIKYKNALGGRFISKKQLRECYVIDNKKFMEIEPYLLLDSIPKKTTTQQGNEEKINIENNKKFNPNSLTRDEWIKLGFTEKQANTILNFKKSLGGEFRDAKTLKKCFVISSKKFIEIEPYLSFKK